jgi:hypothetical protein
VRETVQYAAYNVAGKEEGGSEEGVEGHANTMTAIITTRTSDK